MTEERWQLVPVELTQAMLDATCATEEDDAAMRTTWAELLRVSPTPTPAADEVEPVGKAIVEAIGWNAFDQFNPDHVRLISRAAIAALQARSAEPAGDLGEAFLRLCEEIGIPATAGAYLEYRSRKAEPAGEEPVAVDAAWRTILNLANNHGKTRDDMRQAFSIIASIADKALSRPATPTNPERLVGDEDYWAAVLAGYVRRHKQRGGEPSWSALPGYLAALSAAPLKEGSHDL